MIAAGNKYSYEEQDLPKLRGLNFVDYAIRDTLRVKYRIELSDSELLEFSNYLVEKDPTYPSWSERTMFRDSSPPNNAASPALVFIFTRPTRYYQAYLAFKKRPRQTQKPISKH